MPRVLEDMIAFFGVLMTMLLCLFKAYKKHYCSERTSFNLDDVLDIGRCPHCNRWIICRIYIYICIYMVPPPPPLTKVFFNNLCSGTPPLDASWVRVMSWLGPITVNAALIKPPNSLNIKNVLGQAQNLGKTKNSWKTLAWPMFSMNSCEKTMESIGLANVFHEFVGFQRISWDQPGI